MKIKIFIFILFTCLFLTGCGNNNIDNVVDNLTKKVNDLKSYTLEGNLEIINNDEVFNYRVKVDYQNNDYYKVSLKNVKNNHEQIILKNDDGVYVVTPSLNKSFKFQSEWPYNNSQVYILGNIITDINEDRHLNNFGIIRDVDTLEWLDVCPIFDNGMALNIEDYNEDEIIISGHGRLFYEVKPFDEIIKLVQNPKRIDITKLDGVVEEFDELLHKYQNITHMSDKRIYRLCVLLQRQINKLKNIIDNAK